MISNMCSLIDADVVVWAHCTNPLASPLTYDIAVRTFLQKVETKAFDSLASVTRLQEHLWEEAVDGHSPMNYDPNAARHVLAKDLPVLYKQNGAIFIQKYENMLANKYFFGDRPFLFEMSEVESLDINTKLDYEIACALR